MGAARTPIGSIGGVLAGVNAPTLGSIAIKGALAKAGALRCAAHDNTASDGRGNNLFDLFYGLLSSMF